MTRFFVPPQTAPLFFANEWGRLVRDVEWFVSGMSFFLN
jgi:hypothetical protein